jgi:SNF2 family DNA or RNA helicase
MKLYQHQIECIDKVGYKPDSDDPRRMSALIADDMGLGKTFEGIARDASLRGDARGAYMRPTLIVAPAGTHQDWYDSIYQFNENWSPTPHDNLVCVIDRKNRQPFVDKLKRAVTKTSPYPCYFIMHYEALRLIPELKEIVWFHIIADEVHRIKNRAAQQTRALKSLPTKYKTGLSGTPADNKPQDLWSVLNWLWPKKYSSYWKFVNATCTFEDTSLTQAKTGRSFRKIDGVNPEGAENMLADIRPYYVRRKKDEVGIDLPPKYWTQRWVELGPKQRKAYDAMRKDMLAWVGEQEDTPLMAGQVVTQLIRLQQLALGTPVVSADGRVREMEEPSVKLDDLKEIIEGNPNESIVVFSQSRSMVNLVCASLDSKGISVRPYTGSVPQNDRTRSVQDFQRGEVQVLAGTIAAGGEGITLHRASTVIFLDRMWNPTRNRQAEDRLHRIGQKNAVQVIDIMAKNTVDLGRHQRIASKWSALEMILGDKVQSKSYVQAARTDQEVLVEAALHDAVAILGG